MIPVARDEGIRGDDIEACSDHHAFAKLFPTSDAREARACFDAMQRYLFSASQTRVSTSDSLPSCLPACHPACRLVCLPACLPAGFSVCLPGCLPASLPPCHPTCLPACVLACLPASPSPYLLPACLCACLAVSLFGTVSQVFLGRLCMLSMASACVIVCAHQSSLCIWRRPLHTIVCKCHFRISFRLSFRPLYSSLLCVTP